MQRTSTRVLALLALLQVKPDWSGPELAERLGVGVRTVRNDVARLRELGYPVDAVRGAAGHYRLGVGATLPPLLLDDEEAVAVAVGLRATTGVTGVEESSARALRKLEHVLPHRLRRQVTALAESTVRAPDDTDTTEPPAAVDARVLAALAGAIRDHEGVRFLLGDGPTRTVEPYRLVSWQRHWYLVARDPGAGEWEALRVDRMELRTPGGRRFTPTPLPGGDYPGFVLRSVASAGWSVHARIVVQAPAADVLARINPAVGVVEALDAGSCVLVTGADNIEMVAVYVGLLGLDFRVAEPPELVEHLRVLADRYARAVRPEPSATSAVPRQE